MKLQEIIFKRPVKVLQVYCKIIVYGKAKKSFELRKEETEWQEIPSKSGFVKDSELYLPAEIIDCPNFKECGLITLEDNNRLQAFASEDLQKTNVIASNVKPDLNRCFNLHHSNSLHIFEIKNDEYLQLFLNYDQCTIGIPERKNFELCVLKKCAADTLSTPLLMNDETTYFAERCRFETKCMEDM